MVHDTNLEEIRIIRASNKYRDVHDSWQFIWIIFLINFKTINQVCAPRVSSMTEFYHSIQCNISININCKNYEKKKEKKKEEGSV